MVIYMILKQILKILKNYNLYSITPYSFWGNLNDRFVQSD